MFQLFKGILVDRSQGFQVKKGKAIHVTGRRGPYVCETSRFPHFLDNWLTDGGEARPSSPGIFLVLISVRG
jgi:hypothetical protein